MNNDLNLREKWVKHYDECRKMTQEWKARDYEGPPPQYPSFPEECRGMTCGAKTRNGTACKRRDLYQNGRCRLHGGFSTGPRTPEGKAKSALNGLKPKKRSKPQENIKKY